MAMKFVMVSVRDVAAETFGAPFCVPNEGVAKRSFANEVNRVADNNPMFTNSEHFELFVVGSFDDQSGFVEMEMYEGKPRPRLVCRGEEVKRTVN